MSGQVWCLLLGSDTHTHARTHALCSALPCISISIAILAGITSNLPEIVMSCHAVS